MCLRRYCDVAAEEVPQKKIRRKGFGQYNRVFLSVSVRCESIKSELKLIFFFCPIPRLEILIPARAKHCKHPIALSLQPACYAHAV